MEFDIRRLDFYRKVPRNLTEATRTGACVSIISVVFIVFLMMSELSSFLYTDIKSEIFVDLPSDEKKVSVKINISFPKTGCEYIGLDIQDEMGEHEVGFHENTQKTPLRNGDGCRFEGHFHVNRVPGNFHLSTHNAGRQPSIPDMSHVIHSLQFGQAIDKSIVAFDLLKDTDMLAVTGLSSHDYVIKLVPTKFKQLSGEIQNSFQYSYAHRDYMAFGSDKLPIPVVWFKFDFNPITIQYVEQRKPLYHFITMFCAIIGGTFTVAGIIDSLLLTAHGVFKKAEEGKLL